LSLAALAFCFSAGQLAQAQSSTTGLIVGTVIDPSLDFHAQ